MFLDEVQRAINYWIFQANPDIYDIDAALIASQTKNIDWNWMVNQHGKEKKNKAYIQEGDKVIIWKCGKSGAVLALATVTSTISNFGDENDPYYIDKSKQVIMPRVKIRIDHNFVDKPIYRRIIKATPKLKGMNIGIRGTNFISTSEEYYTILELLKK